MNKPHKLAQDTEAIVEAAAHWWMRINSVDCSDEEKREFQAWLKADPEHLREYQGMEELWEVAEHLPRTLQPIDSQATRRGRWKAFGMAAGFSLLLLPLSGYLGWLQGWIPNSYHRYESLDNNQTITLPDGSRVQLNSHTRISFSNFKDLRKVALKSGEAFFEVAHSTEHPFAVDAGKGRISVTGTQFNVWKYNDQVVVTLTEGSVEVIGNKNQSGQYVKLIPGMQASYGGNNTQPAINQQIPAGTLSWREGKLILDDLSLLEALPLINRYLEKPVLLGDTKSTGSLRIGGIFDTQNIPQLVQSLPKIIPVKLSRNDNGNIVISRRSHLPLQF